MDCALVVLGEQQLRHDAWAERRILPAHHSGVQWPTAGSSRLLRRRQGRSVLRARSRYDKGRGNLQRLSPVVPERDVRGVYAGHNTMLRESPADVYGGRHLGTGRTVSCIRAHLQRRRVRCATELRGRRRELRGRGNSFVLRQRRCTGRYL